MNDEWAKPTIEHNLINPYVQNISTNFLVLHVLNIAKHTYYYAPFLYNVGCNLPTPSLL